MEFADGGNSVGFEFDLSFTNSAIGTGAFGFAGGAAALIPVPPALGLMLVPLLSLAFGFGVRQVINPSGSPTWSQVGSDSNALSMRSKRRLMNSRDSSCVTM